MKITFDPAANADLDDIFAWISKDNERAAYHMIARLEARPVCWRRRVLLIWVGPAAMKARTSSSKRPTLSYTKCTSGKARLSCFPSCTVREIASAKTTSADQHSPIPMLTLAERAAVN
jgi:hypothetical protein